MLSLALMVYLLSVVRFLPFRIHATLSLTYAKGSTPSGLHCRLSDAASSVRSESVRLSFLTETVIIVEHKWTETRY